MWPFKKPKYCRFCGKALIMVDYFVGSYDEQTGKRQKRSTLSCPDATHYYDFEDYARCDPEYPDFEPA